MYYIDKNHNNLDPELDRKSGTEMQGVNRYIDICASILFVNN